MGFEGLEDRQLLSVAPSRLPPSGLAAATAVVKPAADAFERDNSIAQAKPIAIDGSEQSHSLHTWRDVDWVKFTVTTTSDVTIETNGSSGDTRLWLYGPNRTLRPMAFNDNTATSNFSRIDRSGAEALRPGTYYVKIAGTGRQAIENYTVNVVATPTILAPDAFESDDTPAAATPIDTSGALQSHGIHASSDVDWLTFTLTGSETSDVVIDTSGRSGDTKISLYGPDGTSVPLAVDDNSGIGAFSRIVRAGSDGLAPGTYFVKVEESGNDDLISQYSVGVTVLHAADVFLVQGESPFSKAIRIGEAKDLGVPLSETYSHAAIYLGNGTVAEMVGRGYQEKSLADWYRTESEYVINLYRDAALTDSRAAAVVAAATAYRGTPYAFSEIAMFAKAAASPIPIPAPLADRIYKTYLAMDAGAKRMVCSELVARAFADADAPLSVDPWPSMKKLTDASTDTLWDFTSPTMLSLSDSLARLNVAQA